jgi:hypothetical protein
MAQYTWSSTTRYKFYRPGYISNENRILERRNYLKKKVFCERGGDVDCTKYAMEAAALKQIFSVR